MLLLFFFQAEDGIRDHCVTGVQSVLFRSYQIQMSGTGNGANPRERCHVSIMTPRINSAEGMKRKTWLNVSGIIGNIAEVVLYDADAKGETIRRASATFKATYERSEEHTSELQSHSDIVCRLLLAKKKTKKRKKKKQN